jgi:glycosyltransferase involved in cell wall biosynthesis
VFTHGIEVWTPLSPLRKLPLRQSDLVIAPSEYTLQHLIEEQGVSPEKTRKLRWSLGPEFTPDAIPCATGSAPEGFPPGRVILTVGRWDAREAYKGVDHLILALPAVLAAAPDVQLVAVGGGTDLPRLTRLAREQNVSSHVHFMQPMPPDMLASAYAACEVFALPSKGEGFGLVFLEAMSHGKPVIGGAHGGTPEIIEDGIGGYLVSYGDVTALTERLIGLLQDDRRRCAMGAAAFERVRSEFTYRRFADDLERLVRPLLGNPT